MNSSLELVIAAMLTKEKRKDLGNERVYKECVVRRLLAAQLTSVGY
jgi:hypothetical protein